MNLIKMRLASANVFVQKENVYLLFFKTEKNSVKMELNKQAVQCDA